MNAMTAKTIREGLLSKSLVALVLALAIALLPAAAFAEGGTGGVPTTDMPLVTSTRDGAAPATANAAETLSTDTSALKTDMNSRSAATVYYGGSAWRVIGYGGEGVASADGNATLLAAGYMGLACFNEDEAVNEYAKSTLKVRVDGIAEGLSPAERGAIVPRDLAAGEYDSDSTDCVAGDPVSDALLWPLSTKEAFGVNHYLLIGLPDNPDLEYSAWWLRSPGSDVGSAAFTMDSGAIDFIGRDGETNNKFGVRPAFNLDLGSVVLISAAEGGKPSAGGGEVFSAVSGYDGSAWKLTLADDAHSGFAIEKATETGGVYTVAYSGVTATGDNEYISAVIVRSGSVVYYGRVAKASDAEGASVTIDASGKMAEGDELYVFYEQVNDGTETDYASALEKVVLSHLYTVRFVDEDGTELQSSKLAYGETPKYTGATPTKPATAQYTYEFAGWDPEVAAATGEATYTATYNSTVNEYTITFVNYDGSELQSGKVAKGQVPKYEGVEPTRPETAECTYEFAGWDPEVAAVTGDATYKATYAEKPKRGVYEAVSGAGGAWTQGSNDPLVFTFKRTADDGTVFGHFAGILVDGKAVPEKDSSGRANWTAAKGSVVVSLQPSYLATLSEGGHTLTALFDDGDGVEVSFTIPAKAQPASKPAATPRTGDGGGLPVAGLSVAALLALCAMAYAARRRRDS